MRQRRTKHSGGGRSTNFAGGRAHRWRNRLIRRNINWLPFRYLKQILKLPDRSDWGKSAFWAAAALLAVAACATLSGAASWSPQPLTWHLAMLSLALLFVPAIGEEVLFRGILHPPLKSRYRALRMMAAGLAFILWHPVQYWTGAGPAWSAEFIAPPFLITVTMLSVVLTTVREVSRSIWPAVLVHWAAVCGWKLFGGGPF